MPERGLVMQRESYAMRVGAIAVTAAIILMAASPLANAGTGTIQAKVARLQNSNSAVYLQLQRPELGLELSVSVGGMTISLGGH
jgi:hypothetical protein